MMKSIDGLCAIVQEHRKLDTKKRIVLFLATYIMLGKSHFCEDLLVVRYFPLPRLRTFGL